MTTLTFFLCRLALFPLILLFGIGQVIGMCIAWLLDPNYDKDSARDSLFFDIPLH